MDWDKDSRKECDCCIKIDNSIVIIICGDIGDFDKFKEYIKIAADEKEKRD